MGTVVASWVKDQKDGKGTWIARDENRKIVGIAKLDANEYWRTVASVLALEIGYGIPDKIELNGLFLYFVYNEKGRKEEYHD